MDFTLFLASFANSAFRVFFDHVGRHWDSEAQSKVRFLCERIQALMPHADIYTMDTGVIGVGACPLTERSSSSLALLIEKKPRQYRIEVWVPGGDQRLDIISSQRKEIEQWLQRVLEDMDPEALAGSGLVPKAYESGFVPSPMRDSSIPLNQILYGPPGTGKTYHSINKALQILDPLFLTQHATDRALLKARFDELLQAGRIAFVTFHQSFSYEDFVEGIRAKSEDGQLSYAVEAGIFRQMCERAQYQETQKGFQEALNSLKEHCAEQAITMHTTSGKSFEVTYNGQTTLRVRPHSSSKRFEKDQGWPVSLERLTELYHDRSSEIYNRSYALGILDYLKHEMGLVDYQPLPRASQQVWQPYVLIMDEINRGNVANIFGELITLIEPSKRAGEAEALSVQLPYSKKPFSVPHNLYLIATMNSADRHLAQMDYALRRRFQFIEMLPDASLLANIAMEGEVDLARLLVAFNERISRLYDREHTLGHAFFLPLQTEPSLAKLAQIMRLQIIPLLQTYFLHDGKKLQAVLGDELITLPKSDLAESGAGYWSNSSTAYQLNADALYLASSYQHLYG